MVLAVAAIAAVFICLALTAYWSFPSWDDGLFWLAAQEHGAAFLPGMVPDRPLLGWLWGQVAAHGVVVPGAAAYLLTWGGTALVTWRCWSVLFPEWRRFAVVPALLAIAPVLIEIQAVAINPPLTAHLGTVLVYVAFLLLQGLRANRWVLRGIGAAIILLGGSVSEYAPLAAVVAAMVFSVVPEEAPEVRRVRRREYLAMAIVAVVSYGLLRLVSDPGARPEVNVEHQVAANGVRRLVELAIRVPLSLWHAVLGGFLKDLGEVNFSRTTVIGLPVGGAVAALVAASLRRGARGGAASDVEPARSVRAGLGIAGPFAIGLAVITFMASTIRGNVSSRLWIPLLPLAACLTTWALFLLVRREVRLGIAVAVAFLAGYLSANAAASARTIDAQLRAVGAQLHSRLSPSGLTAALFVNTPTNHFVGDPVARPYELMAHLTVGWPQSDRNRFWAGTYEWQPFREMVPGLDGVCGSAKTLASEARGWARKGPLARTIWVSFDPDGGVHLEEASSPRATVE